MLTDTELSEIRARCEAATPGPWEEGCDEKFHVVVLGTEEKIATMLVRFDREQNCCNAIFIAHARTDIPALLAHIEAQRATFAKSEADKAALVAHIEELNLALDAAISQNAATIADHVIHMAPIIAGAIIGDKSARKVCAKVICAHCHEVLGSFEEATAHGSVCKKHPAVIRAMKAEADKAALVAHVERQQKEINYAQRKGVAGLAWMEKDARAILARVKAQP